VDDGNWIDATITYSYKQAIVNFTFVTKPLPPGQHFIEVNATNQWGNEGYANDTVTIPYAEHDIAIKNITVPKTIACQGYNTSIYVELENQGNVSETFNVTTYANTTEIETKEITLSNGNSTIIEFIWNTTGWAKGNYTISAYAWPPLGETDLADNTLFADKEVCVTIPGDVDGDRDVDIYDVVKITGIYGSKRGDPQFNPNSDLDDDGEIKIYDVVRCTSHYGEKDT